MISETLINLDASHQVSVYRYGSKLSNQIVPFLESAKDDLEAQILKQGATIRNKKRLNELLSSVNKTLDKYYSGYITEATGGLEDLVSTELSFVDDSLNSIMVDYDTAIPAPQQVITAATNAPMQLENGAVDFPTAFKGWKSSEITRTQNFIKLGFFHGQTTQQIASQVKNTINGISRRNATSIVRTATNHMASETRRQYYKDNDDLIIGYQWVSTLDSRTTPICRNLDGREFKFTDTYQPYPPIHWGCRSSTTPLLDGRFKFLEKGATRSAEGGPVSSTTQYYDWLKKQSASFQDDVLGKTKGKIFRNSGVSTEEFKKLLTDRMGQELTIDKLAKKDKRIMNYLKDMK